MRFATIVFATAGIWGLLTVTPLYFLYDTIGRRYPPPVTHPDFYYGFVGVTLAWQLAFLVIARDPVRLRPLMLAAIAEKFGYLATLTTLYAHGRLQLGQFTVVSPDAIFCAMFIASFFKTGPHAAAVRRNIVSAETRDVH